MNIISKTDLPLKIFKKGKVRDVYKIEDNLLLIVTDRISAFDFVLKEPIPQKGICLNQISKFWFDFFRNDVGNHMISADVNEFPEIIREYNNVLFGRSMIVKKAKVFPIECIVRGYISGSAWKSYQKDKAVCGIKLNNGMQDSEKFDNPLFTPSTKEDSGHDINISYEKMEKIIGKKDAIKIKELSLLMYNKGAEYARKKGIIIADTKFEFGKIDDKIIIVDEVLTPDSSRFWPLNKYEPGRSQSSYDKQYVRDYLSNTGWDKNSKPPELTLDVIKETRNKYIEAYETLTGRSFLFNETISKRY
jgi:phosphoribosylaminoimidazole-succinocarboxamide synthase